MLKKENQHIELVDILSCKSKSITTAEINSLAYFYRLKLQLSYEDHFDLGLEKIKLEIWFNFSLQDDPDFWVQKTDQLSMILTDHFRDF